MVVGTIGATRRVANDRSLSLHILVIALLAMFSGRAPALELSGIGELSAVAADPKRSFIDSGTGVLRYGESGMQLQQAAISLSHDFENAFSAELVANYYADGDLNLGLTQALIKWKPLSNKRWRWRGRGGIFYPRMSAENVDLAWLSPYTYTPSAINSWVGEEMRIAGIEATLFSPGRARRSPWSWEFVGGLFSGNDPIGSLISWRGFATHDRQSLHHDRVQFAPYPTAIDPATIWSPPWVEPFHEIDNRIGGYGGVHLRHRQNLDLRAYYYDNNGNPRELNSQRLYAWDTRFTSLAIRYDLPNNVRVLAQWMGGSSDMGDRLVGIDFDSYYLMVSRKWGNTRLSLRYDRWDVDENDDFPTDPNSSDGHAWTAAVRHQLDEHWQLGIEYVLNDNSAINRLTLGEPVGAVQQQFLGVIQYRFGP